MAGRLRFVGDRAEFSVDRYLKACACVPKAPLLMKDFRSYQLELARPAARTPCFDGVLAGGAGQAMLAQAGFWPLREVHPSLRLR